MWGRRVEEHAGGRRVGLRRGWRKLCDYLISADRAVEIEIRGCGEARERTRRGGNAGRVGCVERDHVLCLMRGCTRAAKLTLGRMGRRLGGGGAEGEARRGGGGTRLDGGGEGNE